MSGDAARTYTKETTMNADNGMRELRADEIDVVTGAMTQADKDGLVLIASSMPVVGVLFWTGYSLGKGIGGLVDALS